MNTKQGMILLTILSLSTTTYSQHSGKRWTNLAINTAPSQAAQIVEFDVPIGRTVNGFTYTPSGTLLYQGNPFRPAIITNTTDVREFKISLLTSRKLATGISVDGDGQNKLFFMDLLRGSSLLVRRADGIHATARRVFWSPSRRYVVAFCAYEGESFSRIDVETRNFLIGEIIGPSDKMWRVKRDSIKWIGETDFLGFTITEHCNPYDGPNCRDRNKVLAASFYSITSTVSEAAPDTVFAVCALGWSAP